MAAGLLGHGKYSVEELGGDPDNRFSMPLFLFGGSDEWFEQQFGRNLMTSLDANLPDVIGALESLLIGDRELYNIAVAEMQPDAVARFRAKWHEKHITSMNDIYSRAQALIVKLRARLAEKNRDNYGITG